MVDLVTEATLPATRAMVRPIKSGAWPTGKWLTGKRALVSWFQASPSLQHSDASIITREVDG